MLWIQADLRVILDGLRRLWREVWEGPEGLEGVRGVGAAMERFEGTLRVFGI